MRKLGLAIAALALAGFVSGNAHAQSAKFAASWDDTVVSVKAEVVDATSSIVCTGTGGQTGGGAAPCIIATAEMATIHVPSQKDVLIGISGQIGIITITKAKGKNGESETVALAEGKVTVTVELRDADTNAFEQTAAPGPVIFAARLQELRVSSSGEDSTQEFIVQLKLDTTAAHHFNFLGFRYHYDNESQRKKR